MPMSSMRQDSRLLNRPPGPLGQENVACRFCYKPVDTDRHRFKRI